MQYRSLLQDSCISLCHVYIRAALFHRTALLDSQAPLMEDVTAPLPDTDILFVAAPKLKATQRAFFLPAFALFEGTLSES